MAQLNFVQTTSISAWQQDQPVCRSGWRADNRANGGETRIVRTGDLHRLKLRETHLLMPLAILEKSGKEVKNK